LPPASFRKRLGTELLWIRVIPVAPAPSWRLAETASRGGCFYFRCLRDRQLATGLPVAASFALAGGITSLREGRRRTLLNEALHELRRPLQALSLALPESSERAAPVESSLELAAVALERLDREINGAGLEKAVTEVSVDALIGAAVQRWKGAAACSGGSLQRQWNGPEAYVEGDRFDLAQALDNLLSNAIEHGGGRVGIGWRREGGWVCISVSNSGAPALAQARRRRHRTGGRCRRGHGLRVVDRVARRHGGSFDFRSAHGGATASLRLPLRRQVSAG
jgi:two-component system, OmpR family, sensor histidine kinase TctE